MAIFLSNMRVLFVVLAFLTTAYCLCKVNGKDYDEGAEWINDNFMVKCEGTKNGWISRVVGCIVNGNKMTIGDKLKLGKTAYLCEKTKNGVALRYFWY